MSDKTKHHAELAAMIDRAARNPGPEPLPRCACGQTWLETRLVAAPACPDGLARFWCAVCAPPEVKALLGL